MKASANVPAPDAKGVGADRTLTYNDSADPKLTRVFTRAAYGSPWRASTEPAGTRA